MKGFAIFPYDTDTSEIIKEFESYLRLPHKNIRKMVHSEVVNYINELTLLLHIDNNKHHFGGKDNDFI